MRLALHLMALNAWRRMLCSAPTRLLAQTLDSARQVRAKSSHSENTNIFIRGAALHMKR